MSSLQADVLDAHVSTFELLVRLDRRTAIRVGGRWRVVAGRYCVCDILLVVARSAQFGITPQAADKDELRDIRVRSSRR